MEKVGQEKLGKGKMQKAEEIRNKKIYQNDWNCEWKALGKKIILKLFQWILISSQLSYFNGLWFQHSYSNGYAFLNPFVGLEHIELETKAFQV